MLRLKPRPSPPPSEATAPLQPSQPKAFGASASMSAPAAQRANQRWNLAAMGLAILSGRVPAVEHEVDQDPGDRDVEHTGQVMRAIRRWRSQSPRRAMQQRERHEGHVQGSTQAVAFRPASRAGSTEELNGLASTSLRGLYFSAARCSMRWRSRSTPSSSMPEYQPRRWPARSTARRRVSWVTPWLPSAAPGAARSTAR